MIFRVDDKTDVFKGDDRAHIHNIYFDIYLVNSQYTPKSSDYGVVKTMQNYPSVSVCYLFGKGVPLKGFSGQMKGKRVKARNHLIPGQREFGPRVFGR